MKNPLQDNELHCLYNYSCINTECDFRKDCKIFQKIRRIAKTKYAFYNYGKGSNHHHEKDGRLKTKSVIKLYLTALKYGFICPDCNTNMILGGEDGQSSTIDHIVPRSLGGTNDYENLRIVCRDCNRRKSKSENPILLSKSEVEAHANGIYNDGATGNDSLLTQLLYIAEIKKKKAKVT